MTQPTFAPGSVVQARSRLWRVDAQQSKFYIPLDDPDVTVLDLGHPLVRRLFEEVKQSAFQADDGRYGRTSHR